MNNEQRVIAALKAVVLGGSWIRNYTKRHHLCRSCGCYLPSIPVIWDDITTEGLSDPHDEQPVDMDLVRQFRAITMSQAWSDYYRATRHYVEWHMGGCIRRAMTEPVPRPTPKGIGYERIAYDSGVGL